MQVIGGDVTFCVGGGRTIVLTAGSVDGVAVVPSQGACTQAVVGAGRAPKPGAGLYTSIGWFILLES